MEEKIQGSCHCGEVEFQLIPDLENPVRCNCSLCRRKGAVMLSAIDQSFQLLKGHKSLSLYQWNMEIAEHYFCKKCGIYTFHRPRSNPSIYRVNAGCLEGIDPLALEYSLVDGASFSSKSEQNEIFS